MKRVFAALAALFIASATPASAIVIVEKTWRAQGGRELHWSDGFGLHEALAAQPQFRAMAALSQDEGATWGVASGVWIGNDANHAYILTAAHVFDDGSTAKNTLVRTTGGAVLHGERVWVHPRWRASSGQGEGFDFAILQLQSAIADAGPAPVLYSGAGEAGKTCVVIGFGTRGVAPFGHGLRFGAHFGDHAAAAENVIDRVTDADIARSTPDSWGNVLSIDLDQPDGPGKNRYGSPDPVSPLEGILAPGDSGGSMWVHFPSGWRVVGVNSSGDPGADYQDISNFARVSGGRDWIELIFPGVRFAP